MIKQERVQIIQEAKAQDARAQKNNNEYLIGASNIILKRHIIYSLIFGIVTRSIRKNDDDPTSLKSYTLEQMSKFLDKPNQSKTLKSLQQQIMKDSSNLKLYTKDSDDSFVGKKVGKIQGIGQMPKLSLLNITPKKN